MEHLEAEHESEQKIVNKWRNVVKDRDEKHDREKEYKREAAPAKKSVDSKKAVSKAGSKWMKSSSAKDPEGGAAKPTNPNRAAMKAKSVGAMSNSGRAGPSGIIKAPTTDKVRGSGLKSGGSQGSGLKSNYSAAMNRSQSVKSAGLKSKSAPAIGRAASVKKPYVPYKPAPKAGSGASGMGGKSGPNKGGKPAPKMGGMKGGKFPF